MIAAAWKHGLEDQATLPKEFNFLADYHKPGLLFDPVRGFSFADRPGFVRPFFVHVYHHWGDRDWEVWRWLEGLLPEPAGDPGDHGDHRMIEVTYQPDAGRDRYRRLRPRDAP